MYRTYVGFYRTVGRLKLDEYLFQLGLCLYQRKRFKFHHACLVVDWGDETMVYSLTDEGIDEFNINVLNKRYRLTLVPCYFDTNVLQNLVFFLRDTNYRLLVSDMVRILFRRPSTQMVCTDFVNLVRCDDTHVGFKNNTLPETPDELYKRLTATDKRHTTYQSSLVGEAV